MCHSDQKSVPLCILTSMAVTWSSSCGSCTSSPVVELQANLHKVVQVLEQEGLFPAAL